MKFALAIAAIALTSSVNAATPYYVGENLKPDNNITLNFQDTMVKSGAFVAGNDKANIAALEVRGNYNITENTPLGVNLPFFMSSEELTSSNTKRNALGNIGITLGWVNEIPTADRGTTWGYHMSLTGWAPTSRKDEGNSVALANPTTDLYKYASKTWTGAGTFGGYMMSDQFTMKGNVGYGFMRASEGLPNAATKKNGHTMTGQLGLSWHATQSVELNAEYNAAGGTSLVFGDKKYRHAIAPSISGSYENMRAALYGSIPLDTESRDTTSIAFGLNAGYTF